MENEILSPKALMETIVRYADSKKAQDIVVMEVTEQTTLADYFIVMTGTSSTHIKALSEEIEMMLKTQHQIYPHHTEGVTSNWILMDYLSVVVNVFMRDARELYALERLWGDAREIDLKGLVVED